VTPQVTPGGTVSVTLRNESGVSIRGEIEYDANLLQSLQGGMTPGRVPVELAPRGEKVLVLRALPAATGKSTSVELGSIQATGANGESAGVRLEGSGLVSVEAAR